MVHRLTTVGREKLIKGAAYVVSLVYILSLLLVALVVLGTALKAGAVGFLVALLLIVTLTVLVLYVFATGPYSTATTSTQADTVVPMVRDRLAA